MRSLHIDAGENSGKEAKGDGGYQPGSLPGGCPRYSLNEHPSVPRDNEPGGHDGGGIPARAPAIR